MGVILITLNVELNPRDLSQEDLDNIIEIRCDYIIESLDDYIIEDEYLHRGLGDTQNDDITEYSDVELIEECERRKIEDPHADLIRNLYWDYIELPSKKFNKKLEEFFWEILEEKKYG